jgi:hypothetical protein
MGTFRKDFAPLPDEVIDRLKAESVVLASSEHGCMNLPTSTVYSLAAEVLASREEIFRLQLCETVDRIIAEELDDEDDDAEDLLAFTWPGNHTSDLISRVDKAASEKETDRFPRVDPEPPIGLDHDDFCRRLPRMD